MHFSHHMDVFQRQTVPLQTRNGTQRGRWECEAKMGSVCYSTATESGNLQIRTKTQKLYEMRGQIVYNMLLGVYM